MKINWDHSRPRSRVVETHFTLEFCVDSRYMKYNDCYVFSLLYLIRLMIVWIYDFFKFASAVSVVFAFKTIHLSSWECTFVRLFLSISSRLMDLNNSCSPTDVLHLSLNPHPHPHPYKHTIYIKLTREFLSKRILLHNSTVSLDFVWILNCLNSLEFSWIP